MQYTRVFIDISIELTFKSIFILCSTFFFVRSHYNTDVVKWKVYKLDFIMDFIVASILFPFNED